jgi:hypothetical protein
MRFRKPCQLVQSFLAVRTARSLGWQRTNVALKRIDIELDRGGITLFDNSVRVVAISGRCHPLVVGLEDAFQKCIIDSTTRARETCRLLRPHQRGVIGAGDRADIVRSHSGRRRSLRPASRAGSGHRGATERAARAETPLPTLPAEGCMLATTATRPLPCGGSRSDSDLHDRYGKWFPSVSTGPTGACERRQQPLTRAHLSDVCW